MTSLLQFDTQLFYQQLYKMYSIDEINKIYNQLTKPKEYKTEEKIRTFQRIQHQTKTQFYALQQTLLLVLLNNYFTIVIKKQRIPAKKLYNQFIQIELLTNQNETISFSEIIDKRCQELYEYDISDTILQSTMCLCFLN